MIYSVANVWINFKKSSHVDISKYQFEKYNNTGGNWQVQTTIIKDTYLQIDARFEHDLGNTIPENIEIIQVLKKW